MALVGQRTVEKPAGSIELNVVKEEACGDVVHTMWRMRSDAMWFTLCGACHVVHVLCCMLLSERLVVHTIRDACDVES